MIDFIALDNIILCSSKSFWCCSSKSSSKEDLIFLFLCNEQENSELKTELGQFSFLKKYLTNKYNSLTTYQFNENSNTKSFGKFFKIDVMQIFNNATSNEDCKKTLWDKLKCKRKKKKTIEFILIVPDNFFSSYEQLAQQSSAWKEAYFITFSKIKSIINQYKQLKKSKEDEFLNRVKASTENRNAEFELVLEQITVNNKFDNSFYKKDASGKRITGEIVEIEQKPSTKKTVSFREDCCKTYPLEIEKKQKTTELTDYKYSFTFGAEPNEVLQTREKKQGDDDEVPEIPTEHDFKDNSQFSSSLSEIPEEHDLVEEDDSKKEKTF